MTATGPDEATLLVATTEGERRVLPSDGDLRVGRDPLCGIVVDDPRVSREHLEIRHVDGGWRVRDLGTRNGTYGPAGPVTDLRLDGPCRLQLGGRDGPVLRLSPTSGGGRGRTPAPGGRGRTPAPSTGSELTPTPGGDSEPAPAPGGASDAGRVPSATYRATERIRVGRAPDNDVVLDDLQVSRRHAELTRTPDGMRLADRGTRNGTFVNGRRVDTAPVRPGDLVALGRHLLVFDGERLRDHVDTGGVALRAEALTVTVRGRRLLDGVGFDLDGGSLLAVVGPSGAGKSTLLGALTGYRPATTGRVGYAGRDLYADYDELRYRIGLVPQDDILHPVLTVRRALRYAAALRFDADVTAAERDRRIAEVLDLLGLAGQAGQRIDSLSGGQRKRTSVALELLTEPSLLFLDEPTSGLDPALDRDVMSGLRRLADRGRTVVVVTHSTLHLGLCDRVLVLGRGGTVAYFGPPAGVLGHFGATEYADVFQRVDADPARWAARYAATVRAPASPARPAPPDAEPPPARQGRWRQWAVLTRRTVAVTAADRLYAVLLPGLPLALAGLLHLIPGHDGLGPPDDPLGRSAEASQLLVVLIVGAVFLGLAGGIRELVRERAVYRRERAVGLSPAAYLGSKIAVFAALAAVQATLFVTVGLLGRPGPAESLVLPDATVELIVVVWLTAVTSTATGLLVSAFVTTGEQTMPVLVGLVMAQLVLSGGLFAVVGRVGVEQMSWLAPSRWGYAAAAATTDLDAIAVDPAGDHLWTHRAGTWTTAVAVLCGLTLVQLLAARRLLRRYEPGR